jgi:hypothetical protein
MNKFEGDIYAGLAGMEPDFDVIDFGHGVILRRTYAHLMAPYLMAFKPAPPGKHHPAPWIAASGGFGIDITAELFVPKAFNHGQSTTYELARTIVALIRMWATPAITFPIVSDTAFSSVAAKGSDKNTNLQPIETDPRYFHLVKEGGLKVTAENLRWVVDHWSNAYKLRTEKAELSLAIDALDSGQFVKNPSLILVSLWGALESLFSPDKASELSFRVSAFIACYLEPPGKTRQKLQKDIKSLYIHRSKAAHGGGKSDLSAVAGTFNLLRRVLIDMVKNNHVPNQKDLEELLFGSTEDDED